MVRQNRRFSLRAVFLYFNRHDLLLPRADASATLVTIRDMGQ